MRRALRCAWPALLAGLALPATAHAMSAEQHDANGTAVSIGFAAFAPTAVSVVPGEAVSWTNDSVRNHDVVADDGSFDSALLTGGSRYARRFDAPATIAYHCSLHPSMRGTIVVSELLLAAPAAAVGPGRPFALHGRSGLAPGTAVTVQAEGGGGPPRTAGRATVAADGTFTTEVTPSTTTTYRAVAGAASSPPVTLLVLDRHVRAAARRTATRARVTVAVSPPAPGGTVVLQERSAEHFGWYPVRRGRLDATSRTRFTVPLRRRLPLRVVLTLRDGATVLASSGALPAPPRARAAPVGP